MITIVRNEKDWRMIFLFFALYFIHSFIQQMFIEHYYVLDTVMGTLWGSKETFVVFMNLMLLKGNKQTR